MIAPTCFSLRPFDGDFRITVRIRPREGSGLKQIGPLPNRVKHLGVGMGIVDNTGPASGHSIGIMLEYRFGNTR